MGTAAASAGAARHPQAEHRGKSQITRGLMWHLGSPVGDGAALVFKQVGILEQLHEGLVGWISGWGESRRKQLGAGEPGAESP